MKEFNNYIQYISYNEQINYFRNNMLAINILSPSQVMYSIRENFKAKRLSLDLTQEGLANKSGVSLGSLKRFEHSGQIALESLLKLALVLDCLDDFKDIATLKNSEYNTMDELLKEKPTKKRGVIK